MAVELTIDAFVKDNSGVYVADMTLDKDHSTGIHQHNFYELFVVLEGEYVEYINQQKKLLGYGDFHFISPRDRHYFMGKGKGKNILRNIAIDKSYFDCIIKTHSLSMDPLYASPLTLKKQAIENFIQKSDTLLGYTPSTLNKKYIFESLLSDIYLDISSLANQCIPPWLKKACDLTRTHHYYIEGLPKFITLCGKSQEHITREMKKHYHMKPSEFINELRLAKAANELMTTQHSIIDIIYDCGFTNPSYFNRLFKIKYGMTPSHYRKNHNIIFSISI
ncbi:helix-turn-helix domain-containing protein [Vallitalea pronyensis]|uniref:Helix-turn-helix domain-containing protein n=1 Tax=Vallitalea pronyensis TaxID=1348613 RepID=A0A8J8SJ98_9FIRM|nr:helix-turn-helix domain-containing protein [Vallitalea pronyensis]QUI25272.1 helix-turn-helix domain-containing protein [Vallitalea pronyensis]